MRRAPSSRSFGSGLGVGDTRPERAWRRARRERARSRSLASGGETVASRFVDCRGLNANAASGHTPRREGRHEDPTAEEADRHGTSRDPRPESVKSRSRDVFEPASPARDPQRALTQISSLPSPPLLGQPGSVKLMVDKMVATPALQLADVFPPFAWTFGKVSRRRASRRDSQRDVRGRGARPPLAAFLALFVRSHTHTQSAFVPLSFLASRSRRIFGRAPRARERSPPRLPAASIPPSPVPT